MSRQPPSSLYFNDGCVRHRDYVYLAAKPKLENPDAYADHSRMLFYKNPTRLAPAWGHHDLKWSAASVCYFAKEDALYTLGTQGEVHAAGPKGSTSDSIADVQHLGGMNRIRAIGDYLYACGDQGQVYRREASGWEHIDHGTLDREISAHALELSDLDGTSGANIVAVGFHGRIFRFDGTSWSEVSSPTNQHLERVHCVSESEVYACGNRGTFLKMTPVGIEDFSLSTDEHFWGLTAFNGSIYVAALSGIFVFDGSRLNRVDPGLDSNIGSYRLDARDGQLWSFGVDDVAVFDGHSWAYVPHP